MINEAVKTYLRDFNDFEQSLDGQKDSTLQKIRRQAIGYIKENGFPTKKDEEWRFTDVKPVVEQRFQWNPSAVEIDSKTIEKYLFKDWDSPQLVFIDGKFQKEFSNLSFAEEKFLVKTISEAVEMEPERVEKYLNRRDDSFSALNTAFVSDGSYIEIPKNAVADEALHLIFLSTAQNSSHVSYIRNIIKIGENARVRILESYYSLGQGLAMTNTLTDIHLGPNSQLEYIEIQKENLNSYHIGNLFVNQQRDSRFRSFAITFGSALVRNNITVNLNGHGCDNNLYGLYLGHEQQHIDNHTVIKHKMPYCSSHELYQGILSGNAHGVFSGMIFVEPDAQKTDARQSNNCLLLSDGARINSKPQLEIYADDVKCTHGATVGQLDDRQIFYMRSRGFSEQQARNVLIYAYAEKVIEKMETPKLRDLIDHLLQERLQEDTDFKK